MSRERCPAYWPHFGVLKFRILYYVDRATHRHAKSLAMSVNLPQGVVAARLRACKQAIDAFERINHCRERLGHDFVHRKAGIFQNFFKFTAPVSIPTGPLFGEIIHRIVARAPLVTAISDR